MPKEHCGRERHGVVGCKASPIKVTSVMAGEASAGNRREAASEDYSRLDAESLMKSSRVLGPSLVV